MNIIPPPIVPPPIMEPMASMQRPIAFIAVVSF